MPSIRQKSRRRVLVAQSWWQDRLLEGVAQYASARNWILDCEMRWSHRLPLAEEWKGDGIIAYVGVTKPLKPLIEFIRLRRKPVVLTQSSGDGLRAPRVIIPHQAVGRAAGEHLRSLGFRHFAFVEFADNIMEHERRAGFQAAVEAAGHTFQVIRLRELPRRLAGLPRPLGLFALNDQNALVVQRICLDAGFRVPDEFAIVGADNTELLCKFAPVPLTSVNCNFEKQGFEAAALLESIMDGRPPPSRPIEIMPDGVVVRRSTDTLAIPDEDAARALRFLRDHYLEPIRVPEIARQLRQSFRRTQTEFRRHTGRTLHAELLRLRLARAQQLLANRKLKITTVAVESGFNSRHHFIRAFRRATGQSPRDFRATFPLSPKTTETIKPDSQ